MRKTQSSSLQKARNLLFGFVACMVLVACRDEVKSMVEHPTDPETTPTMTTDDVRTLVSDSGITKYRVTAKLWLMYEEAEKPFWRFPEGLLLEQFDSVFNVVASIICDSATYFKSEELWRLDGNVNIETSRRELILTNQLFYSQRKNEIYSDSFVHIEKSDRIIEGYGFVSNDRMTTYSLDSVSGIFPIEQQASHNRAAEEDSAGLPGDLVQTVLHDTLPAITTQQRRVGSHSDGGRR